MHLPQSNQLAKRQQHAFEPRLRSVNVHFRAYESRSHHDDTLLWSSSYKVYDNSAPASECKIAPDDKAVLQARAPETLRNISHMNEHVDPNELPELTDEGVWKSIIWNQYH